VAAQLVRSRRERFRSEDWREATKREAARGWKEYFGYFGTSSIDVSRRAVIHHLAGAWFPNLLHTHQFRHFRFAGSKLILDADPEWGQVRIVWKRAQAKSLHS
jgi:hypothetical protein